MSEQCTIQSSTVWRESLRKLVIVSMLLASINKNSSGLMTQTFEGHSIAKYKVLKYRGFLLH